MSDQAPSGPSWANRKFLCVVDETPESMVALRFAARRAEHTGGQVALLFVIQPGDFQHWRAVEELMKEEAREEAETRMTELAESMAAYSGVMPEFIIREGDTRDELFALIDEDPSIRVLVLGAGSGRDGPGPLVSYLAGQMSGELHVPVTIVPGSLTAEQIDELT